ncbi:flagellar protein FlaG [Butyrivibrio sp. M55]|uniref:flagellar protein FlaG n=1 Tax=Butyrivibrio sp. M55 TaxID=1855323 RepID=UPI0008F3CCAB|nr:flagellar protein FlaG [Butyrivibrio sp. M55]SFU66314.1 flagellar protein FlaG [Butyrivibrio sp. M55]
MGMDGINGFGPLIQQVQPQVKTQSQAQSEVADYEVNAAAQNMDLTVEAADNTAGSKNESSAQNFASNQSKRAETEEQIQADNAKIKKAISEMTKKVQSNAEAVFGIHEKTNRVTIKMVDKETKKVIKEFPPDETLDMIAKVWEIAGILVDEKR